MTMNTPLGFEMETPSPPLVTFFIKFVSGWLVETISGTHFKK